jgi:hypothetical protein
MSHSATFMTIDNRRINIKSIEGFSRQRECIKLGRKTYRGLFQPPSCHVNVSRDSARFCRRLTDYKPRPVEVKIDTLASYRFNAIVSDCYIRGRAGKSSSIVLTIVGPVVMT